MAQSNLNQTEDHSAKNSEALAVETDWSAVAAEISAASVGQNEPQGVRGLQDRAISAFSTPVTDSDPASEVVFSPWSPRRQLACFLGAGALCWMVILAPALL